MGVVQPAFRHSPGIAHIHVAGQTCRMCDQPIANEKAEEVRARMEACGRVLRDEAARQFASENAQIEAPNE